MWTNFFQGVFPSKAEPNSNLQKRITRLFEAKNKTKDCSPTLQDLQTQKNKVRRISSVYEENISAYNEAHNLRTPISKKPFSNKLSSIIDGTKRTISIPQFFTASTERNSVESSIKNLIEMDAEYLETMEKLIKEYVKPFENLPTFRLMNMPSVTERQKLELFGPLENICKLHESKFHPMLVSSSGNIVRMATNFSKMCREGRFNCYIIYAMDEKDCDHRRNVYYRFFMTEIYNKCRLQFDFAPIQQLARYQLIIMDIKRQLEIEKAPQRVIDTVDETELELKKLIEKIHLMRNLPSHKLD